MIKIIFLDIDGVMNNPQSGNDFSDIASDNLRYIIEKTDARIVISSSWKFYGLDWLKELWKEKHLAGEIIDITPNNISDTQLVNANLDDFYFVGKGNEIKQYLDEHKTKEELRYVIIDDTDDVLTEQLPYFVRTNSWTGLSKSDAEKVVAILNGE